MKLTAEPTAQQLGAGAIVLAAIGVALAVVVAAADGPLAGEVWMTRQVQRLPDFLEPLAHANRAVTTTWVVLMVGAAAIIGPVLRREWRVAALLGVLLVVTPVSQAGIKDVIDRPRPTEEQVDLRAGYTSPSFPAGHLMSPAGVYGFAALWMLRQRDRRFRLAAAVTGSVMGLALWANVYVGVHWPSDVLGGLLFGGALATAGAAAAWRTG
jgi:membrane-associated phospholipid phosphatase